MRRALGLTQNGRMQARIRLAEMRFADVLESDYHRSGENSSEGMQYSLRPGAREEVERVLAGEQVRGDVQLTDSSPSIIVEQKGARNLPLMMKASHIRENVFSEAEAAGKGLRTGKGINYHGLGENLFLQVIDNLNDVTLAYRGTKNAENAARRENYFLLVSQFKDGSGNIINVPVYINETGQYNEVFIETNKIATVFGKNDFYSYVQREIEKGNLVKIKRKGVQASERKAPIANGYSLNTLSDTNISQETPGVNTQSMQNSGKNSYDGQKSYLPTDMQERERAAATQKAENTKRLAEQQQQQEQAEQTETAEELKKQNAALQKKVEKLQRELKPTDKKTVREADVLALGRRLVREYSSEVSGREIQADLQNLGNQLVNGTDWQTLRDAAEPVARRIVENASALVNSEEAELYSDLKEYLRENHLTISDTDKADIADYEAFRRRNQQRLHLSRDGVPVDVAYAELQESFGRSLFPEALTHPADQLQHIAEVLDRLQPLYENPHGDIDAAVEMCTGDIIDGLLDESVRQSAPTYADKEKAKRDAMRRQYTARLREAAQDTGAGCGGREAGIPREIPRGGAEGARKAGGCGEEGPPGAAGAAAAGQGKTGGHTAAPTGKPDTG